MGTTANGFSHVCVDDSKIHVDFEGQLTQPGNVIQWTSPSLSDKATGAACAVIVCPRCKDTLCPDLKTFFAQNPPQ